MAFKKKGLYLLLMIYRLFQAIGMRWRGRGQEGLFVPMVGFCFLPLEGLEFPRCRVAETAVFVAGIAFITVGLFVPYQF